MFVKLHFGCSTIRNVKTTRLLSVQSHSSIYCFRKGFLKQRYCFTVNDLSEASEEELFKLHGGVSFVGEPCLRVFNQPFVILVRYCLLLLISV